MKAAKATRYGGPEVLSVVEADKPDIVQGEILVRVMSSAVTPTDTTSQAGEPFIVRLFSGLTKPKAIPGDVFAGVVEKVGKEVEKFKVGDEVFGTLAPNTGAHAEFIRIKADGVVTHKPQNLSFAESAALVDGPLTSNAFLTKIAKVESGESILINGASGSVGIAAVVLAKHFGLEVTAVCSTKNVQFVKSLGADDVVDYAQQDFTKLTRKFDYIYDAVWKSSYSKTKHLLNPQGMYMTTGPSLDIVISFLITRFSKQNAVMGATGPFWKQSELEFIRDLAEQGVLKPIIDSTYDLVDVVDAYKFVAQGHKVGSVILNLSS